LPVLADAGFLDLQEVDRLEADSSSGAVVALSAPIEQNRVLAAHANGPLLTWDLASRAPSAQFNGILASGESISFDPSGRYVASSGCVYDLAGAAWLGPEQPCDPAAYHESAVVFLWPHVPALGYLPGAHFVGVFCETCATSWLASYALGNVDDPAGLLTVGRVVSDRSSRYLAVAFQQGVTRVYPVGDNARINLSWVAEIGVRQRDDRHAPTLLAVDDIRSRLAMVSKGQLQVWRIAAMVREPLFVADIPDVRAISFDHSGHTLLVGTGASLQVWDMETQRTVREYPAAGLSSLTLSPDGRLVIWGDEQGTIHLWAAP
jgi:WD40 repeat protein